MSFITNPGVLSFTSGVSIYNNDDNISNKQCQPQAQVGLPAEAELILMLSSIDTVFHLFKIVLDYTRVDQQMLHRKFFWFQANKVVFH
jgi:hypothetical protein